MPSFKIFVILSTIVLSKLVACEEKPVVPYPDCVGCCHQGCNEIITTMVLHYTDTAGIQPSVDVIFQDLDYDGSQPPSIHDTIRLQSNTVYSMSVTLYNDLDVPNMDITNYYASEGHEYLFCYTPLGVDLTIERTDSDGTYEIGFESLWDTGSVGIGTTLFAFKHQPGVKDGTCAPGETEIEVEFITEIE